MNAQRLEPGDTVYAIRELRNDGSIPGLPDNELIAKEGARGVLINIGHFEEQPGLNLYLVRFENHDLSLGPPVGCWPDEIRSIESTNEAEA
jgi:nitrogen fixation protein NifZ